METPAAPIASAFGPDATALDVVAGHDLRGREAIVTGGGGGIGFEIARALASAGAGVVLAVRDVARGEAAARTLRRAMEHADVAVAHCDLANLASVDAFARGLLARRRPLHLLVANAGVAVAPQGRTVDGFELHFGTNHVGHFALTRALLPALAAAGEARVVVLTSSAHRRADIDFDDLDFALRPYDPWLAYGRSKTANALFAVALTARHRTAGITANAVMPGGVMTGMQRYIPRDTQLALGWIDASGTPNARFKTADRGAATPVWAAVGAELAGIGGRYLDDCREALPWTPERPHEGYLPYALDPLRADRLWEVTERLVHERR